MPTLDNYRWRAVLTCGDSPTAHEGVALIALLAPAHGVVVDHLALSRGTAGPGAWVAALLVDAGQVTGALAGCPALRLTVGRTALMARQTGADCKVVHASALGVWPTWIRIAGIQWQRRCLSLCLENCII